MRIPQLPLYSPAVFPVAAWTQPAEKERGTRAGDPKVSSPVQSSGQRAGKKASKGYEDKETWIKTCEHQLEVHASNLMDSIEKSTGIFLRRKAVNDDDDDEDADPVVDASALHLCDLVSAEDAAGPMRFCGDVAHEILKWTLSEASRSLTEDPETYSTALQLLVELEAHHCFAHHTPSGGAWPGAGVSGREDRAEAKAQKWSRSGRGRAVSLALDSAEALTWRPHAPATLFSHMVVLHDILGQEKEAEVVAQHIQSLFQTSGIPVSVVGLFFLRNLSLLPYT